MDEEFFSMRSFGRIFLINSSFGIDSIRVINKEPFTRKFLSSIVTDWIVIPSGLVKVKVFHPTMIVFLFTFTGTSYDFPHSE
jgi:hypothetical protein